MKFEKEIQPLKGKPPYETTSGLAVKPTLHLETGMLTYLLSNGTANGDHSCPGQGCFGELTTHQLDLSKSMAHMPTLLL